MTIARKLDDVVEAYVSSDSDLRAILQHSGANRDPITSAMALLCEFSGGNQSANGAFLEAKNVDIHGYDTDLCLLFLISWAHASVLQANSIRAKLSEAWTLIHRAKAMISSQTPPEILAYAGIIEARLAGAEGNRLNEEKILINTLNNIPKKSPRRKFIVLELASFLSHEGRLKDIIREINTLSIGNNYNFKKAWIDAALFVNAVETGQLETAERIASEIPPNERQSVPLRNFQKYRILLDLMNTSPDSYDPDGESTENSGDLPDWGLAISCLLRNRVHQALRWSRMCEKKTGSIPIGMDFISFNLLRSELAEGNIEAARRIMDIRHEKGNIHFMDDFFLARIAVLSGDRDAAADRFLVLLKSIDHYEAEGRLCFELRLASELQKDTIFKLVRVSEKMRSDTSDRSRPSPDNILPTSPLMDAAGLERIISSSPVMASIKSSIQQFSNVDVPVLITGETGTGKELVARALHESGHRTSKPFVAINCGAISESLLESELFGHEKGAFSGAANAHQGLFEEARDGTIFLDEIGDISPRLQVVLLRVLETSEIRPVGSTSSRKISCRIVASTNADLSEKEKNNQFRRDLLFRLRRLEIHIPPLADRVEDIQLLASHFLNLGRPKDVHASMSDRLANIILRYKWPGNVRELRNSIERMRLMNSDKLYYDAEDLDLPYDTVTTLRVPEKSMPQSFKINPADPPRREAGMFKEGKSRIRRLASERELFMVHEIMTRNELVHTMEISPNTATKDLQLLCDEGFIEKVQPSHSPRSAYFRISTKKGINPGGF